MPWAYLSIYLLPYLPQRNFNLIENNMNLAYSNLAFYLIILTLLALALGKYMALVFQNKLTFLSCIERPIYKMLSTHENEQQNWKQK